MRRRLTFASVLLASTIIGQGVAQAAIVEYVIHYYYTPGGSACYFNGSHYRDTTLQVGKVKTYEQSANCEVTYAEAYWYQQPAGWFTSRYYAGYGAAGVTGTLSDVQSISWSRHRACDTEGNCLTSPALYD